MGCTLIRDPHPYTIGGCNQRDQNGRKVRLSAVIGNSSLHGLVNVRPTGLWYEELRAYILQQLEDDISVQMISDMVKTREGNADSKCSRI